MIRINALLEKRKCLSRKKRRLQLSGYEEFIESGSIDKLREIKKINSRIEDINSEIQFLQKSLTGYAGMRGYRVAEELNRLADKVFVFETLTGGKK